MTYKKVPYATDASDTNLPESLLRKRIDVQEDEHQAEIDRHPLAWLILTAKKAEERRIP